MSIDWPTAWRAAAKLYRSRAREAERHALDLAAAVTHLKREADAAIKNQAFERARADQNAKAFEQAEAGAAQLREALETIRDSACKYPCDCCECDASMASSALASTPTGSRVLERLKAADECARYLVLVLGSVPDVGEPMTDRTLAADDERCRQANRMEERLGG